MEIVFVLIAIAILLLFTKFLFRVVSAVVYLGRMIFAEKRLRALVDAGEFQYLDPGKQRYRAVGKEKLLGIQGRVTLVEYASTGRYKMAGGSVSLPIANGVRFRVGAGQIERNKAWQATAKGRLILTDRALSFEGDNKNERITWSQIADVEVVLDGFRVYKRNGPPRLFAVDSPNPYFSAALQMVAADFNF